VVEASGLVDFRVWRSDVHDCVQFGAPLEPAARKWYQFLENVVDSGGFVHIADLFLAKGLANNALYDGMVGQLAWHLGQRVEMVYYQSMKLEACKWPLRSSTSVGNEEWSLRAVDRVCTEHVYASKCASTGFKMFGMAVDKVSARSLELCNACIVLPNNVAFEGVPQV
jgi:hypothetical protein